MPRAKTRSSARTAAERKRTQRDRQRQAGLVKVELWLTPAEAERVRKYAERIRRPPSAGEGS